MSSAMPVENYVFTSESVSEGHPDKVCDRISDAILDAFLAREPEARVAVETLTTTNLIVLAGEVRPAGLVSNEEIEEIARAAVRDIGYEQDGFHWRDAEVQVRIHGQSAHIAQGVDQDGAGDQGIMFGYACRETPELMPARPDRLFAPYFGRYGRGAAHGQCRWFRPRQQKPDFAAL